MIQWQSQVGRAQDIVVFAGDAIAYRQENIGSREIQTSNPGLGQGRDFEVGPHGNSTKIAGVEGEPGQRIGSGKKKGDLTPRLGIGGKVRSQRERELESHIRARIGGRSQIHRIGQQRRLPAAA